MSRLRFNVLPETYEKARAVLDESFRSLRTVLDRGWRLREQSNVVDLVVNYDELPLEVDCPTRERPAAVMVLTATVIRTENAYSLTSASVVWEYREGRLKIHDIWGMTAGERYRTSLVVLE